MIDAAHRAPGTRVQIECPDGPRAAAICALLHLETRRSVRPPC